MSSPVLERAMTEDQLLQAVGEALTLFGWRWTHQRRSDKAITMGHVGLPDIIAVRRDRLMFVELKAENGKLRPEQKLWIADLQTVGYHSDRRQGRPVPETWLVTPSTMDRFIEEIR